MQAPFYFSFSLIFMARQEIPLKEKEAKKTNNFALVHIKTKNTKEKILVSPL